jgi:CubicO group peptidase (beta-lactamase class C family)
VALAQPDRPPTRVQTPAIAFDAAIEQATRLPRLHSLLVSQNGELVLERYFNGASASRPANIKSVSKSVISALIGIAIEQGHIAGVEQPIGDFFPVRLGADEVTGKAAIAIEDLLTMQSGLETTSNRNYGAWVTSSDWVGFALEQPLELEPGTEMEYSTGNTHLLSAILTTATGRSTLEFARDALAEPLGFNLPAWPRDPQGVYFGGNDMELTPRQMIAFGELYLNGGRANGRQIVPESWVRASLVPRTESRREAGRYYGYGWWIRRMSGLTTPYAWGFGGQFIVLVPALNLVISTTADTSPNAGRRSQRQQILDLIEYDVVEQAARALRAAPDSRASLR